MHLSHVALAAALALAPAALAPGAAAAATIVYQSSGFAFYEGDFNDTNTIADYFTTSDGIDISATGEIVDGEASGSLLVSDFGGEGDDELLVGAELLSYALGTTEAGLRSLTAVFTMLSGSQAGLFGGENGRATATFTFDLANLDDGVLDPVSVTVSSDVSGVAPVPLPASLPLLLAGLGAVSLLRRNRA